MEPFQLAAIVVSLAMTVAALTLLVPAVRRMVGVVRRGQPAPGRTGNPVGRSLTMLKETFLHTRMLQRPWIGVMHWFVYAAFLFLSSAVGAAYFQLFEPSFAWPLIGHWYPYEWFSEAIGVLSTVGIVFLILVRQRHHPRTEGRDSRFFGSTFWQAYFVEALALLEGAAILFVRAAEWKLDEDAGRSHYPVSSWIGDAFYPNTVGALENTVYGIAAFKIVLAMIWLMVIARNLTMGIAWHRFTTWPNIWFKREDDGSTAIGAMKPLTSEGRPVTLDDLDDLDEESVLGAGKVEDFSWKGILDFTTCTECGRCQSQCPAWNTEKPLSPKLLITALRDHAYAKADGDEAHAERQLVGVGSKGETAGAGTDVLDYFYNPADGDFVIDEDVLWSCTSCGACVQQCPVDIEHVDHIMDMRRYQLLVESNFPAELNQLFKGLENKGNPWNMSPNARMDWAKGLDFDVPVVGEDLESLESVDWLFWVGCAGAYEDRAKKTTRAVAELLNIAGISFGVLGNGETCTGDPARRAGNEFVFQGLAQQNVETFQEYKVKKVVSTCAHCFNTLKNEYQDFGIELEVVHHTQLLNRLVRDGRLTPVADGAGAAKRSITYHDPCYLGRHNQVYSPPRELLQVLPGAEYVEMERNSEKSFCCGAGGARMWMEENLGERINVNRTREAVGTGADQIAVGCPFCRVMLSDGLTAEQANGGAREEVEVLDVAQMLLASVKGEPATKLAPGAKAPTAPAAAPAAGRSEATRAEPQAGDATQTANTVTDTEDVGPLAKASGGTSLFDTDAPESAAETAPAPTEAAPTEAAPAAPKGGSSLFDIPAAPATPEAEPATTEPKGGSSLFDIPAAPQAAAPEAKPATTEPKGGSSLFDIPAPTPSPAPSSAEATSGEPAVIPDDEPAPAPRTPAPTADLGAGGSLFDIPAAAPSPATSPTPTPAEATAGAPAATSDDEKPADAPPAPAAAAPATSIPEGGSLFDIAPPAAPVEAPSEPAPRAASTPAEATSDAAAAVPADEKPADAPSAPAAAAPATSIPEGGSLFDIAAPAVPVEAPSEPASAAAEAPVDEPAAEPVDEKPAAAPPAPAAAAPATSIPEGGSLFDIAPPAVPVEAPSEPALTPESPSDSSDSDPVLTSESPSDSTDSSTPLTPESPSDSSDSDPVLASESPSDSTDSAAPPATVEAVEAEPGAATPPAAPMSGADLSSAATSAAPADDLSGSAADDAGPRAGTDSPTAAVPDTVPADAAAADETPGADKEEPANDRPGHTPRTDADISGAGSLFDL